MPLVSIITPSYNCKKYFLETYKSVISQTFKDFEWIIVDDCSTDGSYEYIENIIKEDKRIKLLKTSNNKGAAEARNVGIEKACGDYIAFLDSDDLWKANKLEVQINFMRNKNIVFSFSDYDVNKSGKIINYKTKLDFVDYHHLLRTNSIGCLTVMIDVKTIGKVYMPTDCVKREDYTLWLDITKKGTKAYRIPESLAIYRINKGSVSSHKFLMMKLQYRVYRKHEKFSFIKSHFYLVILIINKLFKY